MKEKLQRLGQSLMQPVAVMPLAALLMGIGYFIDPNWGTNSPIAAFFISAGGAVLDNLGFLFAVGVAFGIAKENHGAAALAGLVAFLTLSKMLSTDTVAQIRALDLEAWKAAEPFTVAAFDAINSKNVLIGILSGILGGKAYDRFHDTRLPDFLAFFLRKKTCTNHVICLCPTSICSTFILMAIYLCRSSYIWESTYRYGSPRSRHLRIL